MCRETQENSTYRAGQLGPWLLLQPRQRPLRIEWKGKVSSPGWLESSHCLQETPTNRMRPVVVGVLLLSVNTNPGHLLSLAGSQATETLPPLLKQKQKTMKSFKTVMGLIFPIICAAMRLPDAMAVSFQCQVLAKADTICTSWKRMYKNLPLPLCYIAISSQMKHSFLETQKGNETY